MILSYHPHNCTFLLSKIRSQRCSPCVHRDSLQDGSPQTDVLLLQSPKRRRNRSIPVNPCCPKKIQDWQVTPEAGPSPPETCQDHLLHREARGPRPGQQQLRFGSEGCLRSLKPFPPEGGLASVDGILRLISIKSSFMFIAFFALVSTKTAWMESA